MEAHLIPLKICDNYATLCMGVALNSHDGLIALNMMEKIGPVAVRTLRDGLGSIAAIFEADEASIRACPGLGTEAASALLRQRSTIDPQAEEGRAESLGMRIVTMDDQEYPTRLREIHDPPLALYVKGAFTAADRHALAVVGTRHPTRYGTETAARLSEDLVGAGLTVVSGLAEGIDTAAHRAAVTARGRTLAVLGGALDEIYPRSNVALADAIAGSGAVISEFPLGRRPDRTTFPMRNRIVSGLSMGVVLVEAGRKSGALITAREAGEQGRTVFAVPGRVDSPASLGCLDVIRDGAVLVRDVSDILSEMEFLIPRESMWARDRDRPERPALGEDEARLVAVLEKGECDVDALIRASGIRAASMGALLLSLEMKRVIRMLPGRMVELVQSIPVS